MGVGMMNMAGGGIFGAAQQNAMNAQAPGATQQYNPYGGAHVPTHQGVVVSTPANAEELDDATPAAAPAGDVMAFCPNCGTRNSSGANFCSSCGNKLTK